MGDGQISPRDAVRRLHDEDVSELLAERRKMGIAELFHHLEDRLPPRHQESNTVENATSEQRLRLARIPTENEIGLPVMVFSSDSEDWTVLGDRGIGGEVDGRWRECQYSDVDRYGPLRHADVGVKLPAGTVFAECGATRVCFRTYPGLSVIKLMLFSRSATSKARALRRLSPR